jgi:hypothetical protein
MDKNYIKLISGLLIIPSIFLNRNLALLFIQVLFCIYLAIRSGRNFRLFFNLLLILTIPLIHLAQPNGLIITTVFSFPITSGALAIGLRKALILISLLYLSFYMVSDRPQFPGKLGSLVSLQLFYFGQITLTWSSIEEKRPLIEAIDNLLLALEDKTKVYEQTNTKEKGLLKDYLAAFSNLFIFYGLFFIGLTLNSGLLTI